MASTSPERIATHIHQDAKRPNIPTAEHQSVMTDAENPAEPFPFLFFVKGLAGQQKRQFLSGIPLIRRRAGCIVHIQFTNAVLLLPVRNRSYRRKLS